MEKLIQTHLLSHSIYVDFNLSFSGIVNKDNTVICKEKNKIISREELAALANIGYSEGVFSKQENRIIQNILNLKKVKASEIMTPRVVVLSADENSTIADFKQQKEHFNFSRIPLYSEQNEKITGYVFLQDILEKMTNEKNQDFYLRDFRRDILTVPNAVNLFSLFNQFLEKKEHIAVIVDEYGGLDGIITMEDIIETLLGLEIIDEKDQIIDMQEYAKEKFKNKEIGE